MPKRPTLRTIAQLADLSHAAVSKALRDAPDISDATKERVRRIADELGYTPNLAARNLHLQRASTIGMIVPAMGDSTAYDQIFNEISAAAAARELCVMLGSSHRDPQLEARHCSIMVGNQVGALLVAPCSSDTAHIKARCGSTPVIFLGGKADPMEDFALLCDYRRSGELAVEHLTGLGHRDIALLTYVPENRTIQQKEEGFSWAMTQRGLTPRILRTGRADDTFQAGMDAVEALLAQDALPTALWCASDAMAIGAIKALHLRGRSVPDDVSVMGHDDLYLSLRSSPGLTTLHTPMAEIGQQAVSLALALMEQEAPSQTRQVFSASLVVRESTGPVRRL